MGEKSSAFTRRTKTYINVFLKYGAIFEINIFLCLSYIFFNFWRDVFELSDVPTKIKQERKIPETILFISIKSDLYVMLKSTTKNDLDTRYVFFV